MKNAEQRPLINGMTMVNNGALYQGTHGLIEVLGPGYSAHRDRMVCLYMMEGNHKVVCVYMGGDYFIVYRYKHADSLSHYGFWRIDINSKNPKYKYVITLLKDNWELVFNGGVKR